MRPSNFLVLLLAIIAVVIYAYYTTPTRPEKAISLTPREYIQKIEADHPVRREGTQQEPAPATPPPGADNPTAAE